MSAEERALASGALEKELRSGHWRKPESRCGSAGSSSSCCRSAKEVSGVPSHGAVISERFRGRCGETSRKAGCLSRARPV